MELLIHSALDLTGGAAFWCIYRGCQNPDHQHRAIVRFFAHSRRGRIALMVIQSLIIGAITVRLVG